MKVGLNLSHDNIVVTTEETETKTDNGIIIPDSTDDIIIGVVVAIGDEVKDKNIKIGSIILFKKSSSANFNIFFKKYRLIAYKNIIGCISENFDISRTSVTREV
jgi:co-chaperonin GroES (HSP10)